MGAAFRKTTLPTVAEFKSLLPSGVLIVENGGRAILNVIKKEQRSTKPGTVEYSSTTITIPFVLDNGVWKLRADRTLFHRPIRVISTRSARFHAKEECRRSGG